ncbi:MAG: DUF3822 family protein [Bacteroidales bacterium]|nr:DUF3822 family protein [Bacteroidales bacterium]
MALQLNPYISYFDKSFRESQTRSYTLSIQLWLKGLFFTVYNPEKNKFIGLEAYNFSDIDTVEQLPAFLGKVLNNKPSFAFPYKSVFLIYQNKYSTLIPQPLFSVEHKNLYLGFNQPFQENSRIVFDKLRINQAVNIYYLSNFVVEKAKDFWPNVKLLHYSTALITSLSINFKNKVTAKTLFVNLHKNHFDIVHFKENKLHYFNSFEFQTKEDFIYFLLITIDQLILNPEDVKLIISGNIDKTDDTYKMIQQYIKNYSFISRNDNYSYSFVMDELKYHRYYTLFNALQCE